MEVKAEDALILTSTEEVARDSVVTVNPSQSSENTDQQTHPLKYSWCLWFLDGESTSTNWIERLDRVAAVSTLEEFGTLYQSMKEPSQLSAGTDLYFFRRGIRPLWDHPANAQGGRWILSMGDNMGRMDAVWTHLLVCVVGGWFQQLQSQICGVVANVRRRKSKICVWTKCGPEKSKTLRIGIAIKEVLKIKNTMVYELHAGREKANHKAQKVLYRL